MLTKIFEKLEEFDREYTHFDVIYSILNEDLLSSNGKIMVKSYKLLKNLAELISNNMNEEASSFFF